LVVGAFCFREGELSWALANETLIKQDITNKEKQGLRKAIWLNATQKAELAP